MDITGSDYTYLANIAPAQVELLFSKKVTELWITPFIDVFDRTSDHLELFFGKDVEMSHFQDENGFVLNEEGQGCFMLCARQFSFLQCDVTTFNITSPDDVKGMDPYDSKLFLADIWEYTLVLPTLIEESPFSQKIHDYLMGAISEAYKLGQP